MSRSIFTCCNGFDEGDKAESTQMTSFKKLKTNFKKNNKICTPKASLKNLVQHKFSKNILHLESLNNQNTLRVNEIPRITPHNFQFEHHLPPPHRLSQQYLSPCHNNVVLVSPIGRQLALAKSAAKEKIRFSHDFRNSVQNSHMSYVPQGYRMNIEKLKAGETMKFIESYFPQQKPIKQKQNNFQISKRGQSPKILLNIKEEIKKQNPSELSSTRVKLGDSKFTIQSEEQVQEFHEQKKPVRLEQSAIIVNVFNPTESQMDQWRLNQKTNISKNT